MRRPKKDIEKLDENVVTEESNTNETVTAEVVADIDEVSSKKIAELEAQLAEKEKLIETVSAGSQRKVRGKKIKTMAGGTKTAGFINIYETR